nr:hypothetical protein [Tanacetum cinerariifolium]
MAKPMKEKLKKYFERMPAVITCVVALNPCFNVDGVELLIETISMDLEFFDDGHATKAKKWFNDSLEGLYNIYYAKSGNPTTRSRSGASSSRVSGGNQLTNLLNRLKEHKNKKARSDSSLSSEYERFVHLDFITHLQYSEFQDHFDAQERKQHESTLENALHFEDEILDAEVQENEATSLSDEEIAIDAASQGTMASSSKGEEQDFDFDLTKYGIDD